MIKSSIAYLDFYKSQITGSVLMNQVPDSIFLTKGEILPINHQIQKSIKAIMIFKILHLTQI